MIKINNSPLINFIINFKKEKKVNYYFLKNYNV